MTQHVSIDREAVSAFCRRHHIARLALFGSVLRDDFRPESDIDVLVSLEPDAPWSLWEWIDMKEELADLFGRDVDLMEKDGLRNPFRRHAILTSKQVIYATES